MRAHPRAVVLALSLLLAACGGDSGTGPPPPQTTGSIRVTVSTNGEGGAPANYQLSVNGVVQPIGSSDTLVVGQITPGTYTIAMDPVVDNCRPVANTQQTVHVTAGSIVDAPFTFTCYLPVGDRLLLANKGDVYIMNPDGSGLRSLVRSSPTEYDPIASPDGAFVAYTYLGDTECGIRVMDADGQRQRMITSAVPNLCDGHPTWSPDGTRIAFDRPVSALGGYDIWIVNADGSGAQNVTNTDKELPGGDETRPSWSPDGGRLLFQSPIGIYVMKADGTERTRLTSSGADQRPSWSPAGDRIVFGEVTSSTGSIFTVRTDGSDLTMVTGFESFNVEPAWSPDGDRIAFIRVGDTKDLYSTRPDGTDVVRLTVNQDVWDVSWNH